MTAGLQIFNDNKSLLLSSDTVPIVFQQKVVNKLTTNTSSKIPLSKNNDILSVYYFDSGGDNSRMKEYGIFAPFGAGNNFFILPDKMTAAGITVEEYQFKASLKNTANHGLQLFDGAGREIYNSNNIPISIIDKVSINVSNSWTPKTVKTWSGFYPNKKVGFLFTNVPMGITKSSSMAEIWAYDYRPYTDNTGMAILTYTPTVWSYSYSSASIPIDYSLRLEFFIIDVSMLS